MSGDNVALSANRHFSALGIKCPSGFDFSFFQGIVKDFCGSRSGLYSCPAKQAAFGSFSFVIIQSGFHNDIYKTALH